MKQLTQEIKYLDVERELSTPEVIDIIIETYDDDEFRDSEMLTPAEFSDEVKVTLKLEGIIDISGNEYDEIVDKAYQIYITKFNEYINREKESERELLANRELIKDTLQDWYDYNEEIGVLSIDEVIDLIIENGNK